MSTGFPPIAPSNIPCTPPDDSRFWRERQSREQAVVELLQLCGTHVFGRCSAQTLRAQENPDYSRMPRILEHTGNRLDIVTLPQN